MNIDVKKYPGQIVVKSDQFYGGIDFERVLEMRLKDYFLERGFKIDYASFDKLVVSKGNLFTNLFTMHMNRLKRTLKVYVVESDQIVVESNVDTSGQTIRKSEQDFFKFEVEDIVTFIQRNEESDRAERQNSKALLGNYQIVVVILLFLIAGAAFVISIISQWS